MPRHGGIGAAATTLPPRSARTWAPATGMSGQGELARSTGQPGAASTRPVTVPLLAGAAGEVAVPQPASAMARSRLASDVRTVVRCGRG